MENLRLGIKICVCVFAVTYYSHDFAVFRTEVPVEGAEAVRDGARSVHTGKRMHTEGCVCKGSQRIQFNIDVEERQTSKKKFAVALI